MTIEGTNFCYVSEDQASFHVDLLNKAILNYQASLKCHSAVPVCSELQNRAIRLGFAPTEGQFD